MRGYALRRNDLSLAVGSKAGSYLCSIDHGQFEFPTQIANHPVAPPGTGLGYLGPVDKVIAGSSLG